MDSLYTKSVTDLAVKIIEKERENAQHPSTQCAEG